MSPRSAGSALGAATRLLVLGAVMIFQPVHGYFLRRELTSWQVGDWASIHPGSIYNALRSLSERGLLEEAATEARGARPARTTFRLTDAGQAEFLELLRAALRGVDDPTAFMVAVNFGYALPRAEVLDAVGVHLRGLEAEIARTRLTIEEMLASPEKPDTATEVMRILAARLGGEAAWARDYLDRIRGGAYSFVGEEPDWYPTEAQITEAIAAGAHLDPRGTQQHA
ncbi:PadR family transcriptional regulator [Cellulomonas sp. KRMCY2]|uniref:PadR family transcriptional regulator n=1 Tax=Cellulomonas sp. KRMCY2 TaxID=1304865 RepID=UPI00045EA2EB|nr:PadR family transcriptional regulator [Cellulomonas sp. KRMCY2]